MPCAFAHAHQTCDGDSCGGASAPIAPYETMFVANDDTPWFPFGDGGVELQARFVVPSTGMFALKLRGPAGASLGIHRHYGSVIAYTLAGHWRYLEHDWTAKKGDQVVETPGSVHTLVIPESSPENAEVMFYVTGTLEFLGPDNKTAMIYDWCSLVHMHTEHCKANGIDVVDLTRPRAKMDVPLQQ